MAPLTSSFVSGLLVGLMLAVLVFMVPESQWMRNSVEMTEDSSSTRISTKSSIDGSARGITTFNYWKSPDKFLDTLSSCEDEPDCRIYFHHAHKTGGTSVEWFFQEHLGLEHTKSCCDEARVKKFFRHRQEYCNRKFLSHEVNATAFFSLVKDCVDKWPSEIGLSQDFRVVVLSTFRDPIQMAVSLIQQLCNKNLEKRSESLLKACKACRYDEETEEWLKVIDFVTLQLQNSYQVATWNTTSDRISDQNRRLQILTLDSTDLDDFFRAWLPKLWNEANTSHLNPEDVSFCRFAAPSVMLRAMDRAQAFYRQLLVL